VSAAGEAARTLADVIVAPGSAWQRLAGGVPVAWLCVWVSALHVAAAAAQSHVAWGVVAAEATDVLDGARAGLATVRVAVVAATPLATLARAWVVAVALGATATAPRRRRLALALALETVPWIENAAAAAVAVAAHPADLAALQDVRLRAGLDLVWQPRAAAWAAVVGAANAFSLWWAVLFACGARRVLGAPWRRAILASVAVWSLRVAWRAVWVPTP